MTDAAPRIFDARLHPEGLSDRDLDSMQFFGLSAAVVTATHFPEPTVRSLLGHFDDVVGHQLPRLERAGIRAHAALGVHPAVVPRRGLSHVLDELPAYFQAGKVVAVGAIGLHQGGEEEEEAFLEQLALARRLKLPVLVTTPYKDKERLTKRTLVLLQQSEIPPARVLVDRVNGRTVKSVLEFGFHAGLTVHPEELTAERAAQLIRKLGPSQLVLDSNAGDGAGDILGVARLVHLLQKAKLSQPLISRVGYQNAMGFFRLAAR